MSWWRARLKHPPDQDAELLAQSGEMRDQLLASVAKLENYTEALQGEVTRIRLLAARQDGEQR